MVSLIFTYSGFLVIFSLIAITYLVSSYVFSWIHPTKSQNTTLPFNHKPLHHVPTEPLKIVEESYTSSHHYPLASSPLFITTEENIMDIEAVDICLETNPDIYLINGFYRSILNETLFAHHKHFLSIITFHIAQSYFHELFRIKKDQIPLFNTELQKILNEYDSQSPNSELEKKFYSLFKSPIYKRFNYEMNPPEPSSLFSQHHLASIRR